MDANDEYFTGLHPLRVELCLVPLANPFRFGVAILCPF